MQLYEALAAALIDLEVQPMFGVMGDANMAYVAKFRERGGKFVAAAHESGAVGMADSWSRATGRVGIATVTHGPGLTNTMTALVEAVRNRSSILVLTGDTPAEPTHFQRLELSAFASAAGAGYERVYRPETLIRDLERALRHSVTGRQPVVLNVPHDLLRSDVEDLRTVRPPARHEPVIPGEERLDSALGLIAASNRPVVLAGRGAVVSGARESLIALSEVLAAPLATSVQAKDLFVGHPSNLGICGNLAHGPAGTALAESDCVIAFGASLNVYTSARGELFAGKKIVQVDHDPSRFGWYTAVTDTVVGDVREVAWAMVSLLQQGGHEPNRSWLRKIQTGLSTFEPGAEFADASGSDTVDIRTAAIRLDGLLPARRNVVSDSGRFVHAAWPYLHVPEARGFTAMGAFGAVGLGLAGAVGMSFARPDEPTVCVIGDGGFMMSPAELATAVRENLPLVVVVFNDGAYGAEYHKLAAYRIDPAHSFMSWPDIRGVAQGFGARAISVRKLEELDEVASLTANLDGPLVIDIRLDPTVDIAD
ncbi:thiamine pyrophosphate-binding protein [Amycolatopsis rhabdoformis]|uniref:Thiamine pyrophosphate-binding protein n=1 Tax=Amycolatopsis rhabdoformis TaxID=1448059 RepID=A0ABZ1IJM9_9PSEU|nr:thiamine pyrophosphate-binding protein [Amycolatopsis rhabdoformis]WSE34602.1 thiamine pyrophosphate-binding protein [Amycolatopsis rhabdoformis]